MSDETYYRIVTTWYDEYRIEYSYDKHVWHTCTRGIFTPLGYVDVPYDYIFLFFAKRRLRKFVKRDAKHLSNKEKKNSFVPKVVYGPYP